MRTKELKLCEVTTSVLFGGFEGEQNYRRFVIDASEVFAELPDAVPGMAIKPPVGEVYPKAVERDGNNVIFTLSASDCANEGTGEYQLTFSNVDEIGKTFKGLIRFYSSLVSNGEAPDPVADWVESANATLQSLEEISATAEELPSGSEPTAEVETVGGHKNIAFGIPAGQPGEPGQKGDPGKKGDPGVSPSVSVAEIPGGHEITITDAEGTDSFDVMDGAPGEPGEPGQPGFSPVATVTKSGNTATITVTDQSGTTTAQVTDGNPEDLIDDSSTATNRTWSAQKLNEIDSATKSAINQKADASDIPTKVSDLVDDSGHYTKPSTGIPASDLASGVIPSVPVQDVQVNGTSVLSQGVANVPIADADNPGAVKVNANFGIAMASSNPGTLRVNSASAGTIKTGTNTSQFINASMLGDATFYGMAKCAGDTTQSSSSNPVGQFTEQAKQKINAMLEPQFRLIKEITITEEIAKIYVNSDSNNNPFALNELLIYCDGIATTTGGTVGLGVNMGQNFYNDSGAFIYITNFTSTGNTRTNVVNMAIRGGRFFADAITNVPNSYSSAQKSTSRNAMGIIPCNPITEICIGQANSYKFTSGTITIYGR